MKSFWVRRLSILLFCCALPACTVKTSYRFLDWIIAWQVDDYITLTRSQQVVFDQQLAELLSWHKATQLVLYRDWLVDGKVLFQQPLKLDQLNRWLNQAGLFWPQLMAQLTQASAQVLVSLSDQQVAAMMAELGVTLADDRDEYRQLNQRQSENYQRSKERQSDKIGKHFRRWLGDLSVEQRQWINDWVEVRIDTQGLWLDNRQQWLNDFERVLGVRHQADFSIALADLFMSTEQRRSGQYQAAIDQNTESALHLIIKLQASLSDRQKRHFNREIDYWIKTLSELAGE